MDSCPKELEPFENAYIKKIKEKDYFAWLFNQYTLSAVSVAVEHCLAGNKAKSEYIKKPMLSDVKDKKTQGKENMELVAVFEMKKRTHMLETIGLPESPI